MKHPPAIPRLDRLYSPRTPGHMTCSLDTWWEPGEGVTLHWEIVPRNPLKESLAKPSATK